MRSSSLARCAGHVYGKYALSHILEFYERRCATFALGVSGGENLCAVQQGSYLIVANHVILRPDQHLPPQVLRSTPLHRFANDRRLALFNCPADSFVMRRAVREQTRQNLRIVSRGNRGIWSSRPLARLIQAQITHPFGHGLREGLGHIALDPTGRNSREFFKSVESHVKDGSPIVIFPGKQAPDDITGVRDILVDGGINPGAAHLARRFGIPIVPAYISGAQGWNPGQPAGVAFGPAFDCAGMSKEAICREIVQRVQAVRDLNDATLAHQFMPDATVAGGSATTHVIEDGDVSSRLPQLQ
jgi:1-acyl-sn-glycerol-3-phosphate acyltransferase